MGFLVPEVADYKHQGIKEYWLHYNKDLLLRKPIIPFQLIDPFKGETIIDINGNAFHSFLKAYNNVIIARDIIQ